MLSLWMRNAINDIGFYSKIGHRFREKLLKILLYFAYYFLTPESMFNSTSASRHYKEFPHLSHANNRTFGSFILASKLHPIGHTSKGSNRWVKIRPSGTWKYMCIGVATFYKKNQLTRNQYINHYTQNGVIGVLTTEVHPVVFSKKNSKPKPDSAMFKM